MSPIRALPERERFVVMAAIGRSEIEVVNVSPPDGRTTLEIATSDGGTGSTR